MKRYILFLFIFNFIQQLSFAQCTPVSIVTQPQNQNDSIPGHAHFSVTVAGTAPYNYYWYKNGVVVDSTINNASASNIYDTPPLTMADSNATYYCIITNCAGVNQVTSDTVHLLCIPVAIIVQPLSQTFTTGNMVTVSFSVTVSGTPPFTYKWYKNGTTLLQTTTDTIGSTSVYSFYANPVVYGMNGDNYHCVVTNCNNGIFCNGGSQVVSNNAVLHVYCQPVPAPIASNSTNGLPQCQGSSIQLFASTVPGATYSWTNNMGFTSSSQNPLVNLSYFFCGNYSYSVTATINGCTSNAGVTSVAFYVRPSITVSNTTICSGGNVNFCGNACYSLFVFMSVNTSPHPCITISHGPNISNCYRDTLINNGITPCTIVYYVTASAGCFTQESFTITVNPSPQVTVNSPALCSGQTANLTANGAVSYTWSAGAIPNGVNTATASPVSSHTYTVIGTGTNGCTKKAYSTVTVNPYPTIAVTANEATICSGSTDTLIANGAASYTWSAGASSLGIDSATINPSTTSSYTVIGTTNGCSDTAIADITVNPSYSFVTDQTICTGATYNWQGINYSSSGTYTANYNTAFGCDSIYTLNLSLNADSLIVDTATCNNYTLNSQTYSASGSYLQTLTNINGCDSVVILNLTINPSAPSQPSSILGVTHVCEGSSTAYGINYDPVATSYTWTLPSNWTGISDSTIITATADTIDGIISVTANNSCGSSPPQTVNVYGSEMPVVTLASFGTVCQNITSFPLTQGNPPGGTYSGQGVNGNIFSPSTVGAGSYYITYTYVNDACTVMDSLPIIVDLCTGIETNSSDENITIIPNPAHGIFSIKTRDKKIKEIRVFDVLGELVFHTTIQSPQSIIDLSDMTKGVYFLQIEDENKNIINRKIIKE